MAPIAGAIAGPFAVVVVALRAGVVVAVARQPAAEPSAASR